MATNQRDVSLTVAVKTAGTEGLQQLADDVRGVGGAAASSAPGVDRLTQQLEALTAATAGKRDAERSARAEEAAARGELDARRDALARTRAGADAATKATAEHQAAVRAERLAVVEAGIALRERRAALSAASQEAKQAAAAERAMAEQLAASMRGQVGSLTATAGAVETLRGQYRLLQSAAAAALGGTLVGGLARDLAATADGFANLQARIKLVTGEGQAFGEALKGVQDIALRTGSSLETTGQLFSRILQAGKEFGLAQRDALALTETINQAVQLSGTSAQASEAAITQLVQGLQSGVLRGEEFNSVLEQSPRLAQALGAGLNVTIGELRNLAQQGALTSRVVIDALRGQSQALQSEFSKMPPTVERALGRLAASWQIYIGGADKATGATGTAARAIEALAGNLDTLGNVLVGLGKAAVAFKVIELAAGYFRETAAATAAAATATAAHTVAVTANTAAQTANAAATTATVASVGRLAALMATLRTFTLVGLLVNAKEIGTAIGEGVAKLMGAGKALEDFERAARADAVAARAVADATAAMAQAKALAAEKALGLNKEAREMVAEFEGVVTKTNDTSEALGKLSKALRLGDLSGIQAAGAALDTLGVRGKLSADQIKQALADALKGADLLAFETTARAAFDSSEQGARRFKAAVDAVADESLRRAGTSAGELKTGFAVATTSAINDLDTLARTLRDLGAKGEDAGRALSTAVDKALAAANTERAVRAVVDRVEELGRAGMLAGDRLTDGLDKARKKLDDLRPGVNSLAEAMRAFGLQSRDEIQQTATRMGEAYQTISTSAGVSLRDQIEAYGKWRTAALKASGDVETQQLAEQRVILENRAAVAGLGDEFARAMGKAGAVTRAATQSMAGGFDTLTSAIGHSTDALERQIAAEEKALDLQRRRDALDRQRKGVDANGFSADKNGNTISMAGAQLEPPSGDGMWTFVNDARVPYAGGAVGGQSTRGVTGYWARTVQGREADAAKAVADQVARTPTPASAPVAASAPAAAPSGTRTVNISIAGLGSTSIAVASDADVAKVEAVLRQLETAMARAG